MAAEPAVSALEQLLTAGERAVSLSHLTHSELQLLLAGRGQDTAGTHTTLLQRLQAAAYAACPARWTARAGLGHGPRRGFACYNALVALAGSLYLFGGSELGSEDEGPAVDVAAEEALMVYCPRALAFRPVWCASEDEVPPGFAAACPLPPPLGLALVAQGRLWALGAIEPAGQAHMTLACYDPQTNLWQRVEQLGEVPSPRELPQVVAHGERLLMYGYANDDIQREDARTLLSFHISSRTWTRVVTSGMAPAHQWYVWHLALRDERWAYALVLQEDMPRAAFLVYRLNLATRVWSKVTPVGGVVPSARCGFSITQLGSDLIMHGGYIRQDPEKVYPWRDGVQPTGETWRFSMQQHRWELLEVVGGGALPRAEHAAAVLHDSIVLVGGVVADDMPTGGAQHEGEELADRDGLQPIEALQLRPAPPEADDGAATNCELATRLRPFFQSGELADVVLVAEGRRLAAHRVVLAAQSPTFAAMFGADMREGRSREVAIEGMSADTLEALVRYMYGALGPVAGGQVGPLFRAADAYQVASLRGHLADLMARHVDAENAAAFAQLAGDHDLPDLYRACTAFAADPANRMLVVQSGALRAMMAADAAAAQAFLAAILSPGGAPLPARASQQALEQRRSSKRVRRPAQQPPR